MSSSLIWGKYTWLLFHTMAEKIKPEHFNKEKKNIIQLIKSICSVLPCPTCVEHSAPYVKLIDNVKNQYDLKLFFLKFHNAVNKRRENTLEKETILETYKNKKLYQVINLWLEHFKTDTGNSEYMSKALSRKVVKTNVVKYFKQNLSKFS